MTSTFLKIKTAYRRLLLLQQFKVSVRLHKLSYDYDHTMLIAPVPVTEARKRWAWLVFG